MITMCKIVNDISCKNTKSFILRENVNLLRGLSGSLAFWLGFLLLSLVLFLFLYFRDVFVNDFGFKHTQTLPTSMTPNSTLFDPDWTTSSSAF